jgi:hypothetical protein
MAATALPKALCSCKYGSKASPCPATAPRHPTTRRVMNIKIPLTISDDNDGEGVDLRVDQKGSSAESLNDEE